MRATFVLPVQAVAASATFRILRVAFTAWLTLVLCAPAAAQEGMGATGAGTCTWPSPAPPKPAAPNTNEPPAWKVPPRPAEETKATAPLNALNTCSRDLYHRAHDAVRGEATVVVIVRDAGATLLVDGKPVETKRILPATYFNLRYASHVPLAVVSTLSRLPNGVVAADLGARLRAYATLIETASPAIDTLPLSEAQKQRQHRLLDTSLALLRRVEHDGRIDPDAVAAYARGVSLDVDANIRDAGRAQVDGLHDAVLGWRTSLTDAQWCQLRFVVRVRQQARFDYGGVQYLAAVMGDSGDGRGYPGESERVIVREPSSDSDQPWDPEFDLLATIDLDAAASEAIFGDRDRLTVDVAAFGARERVRELDFRPLSRAICYP